MAPKGGLGKGREFQMGKFSRIELLIKGKQRKMMKIRKLLLGVIGVLFVFATQIVVATETENLNINILPVPGKEVIIDGAVDDWDLSGGVFVCMDVENLRVNMAVWVHVMYDKDNLYVLARWIDETPMSNPGLAGADQPWQGDSLQMRIMVDPEKTAVKEGKTEPVLCWANGWLDRNGTPAIDIDFPNGGGEKLKEAIGEGAYMSFKKNADGKGYIQEIALPWTLLINGNFEPKTGERIKFSVEPNFNTGANYRISMKDIFAPGVTPDRVFTFTAYKCWGFGTLKDKGNIKPQKLRLADRREFDVVMQNGVPEVNWTGLYEEKKRDGFAKIKFAMPEDGYVSLNIKNSEGEVVRQLLNANFKTKGKHEVLWDGLTNTSHMEPGEVVATGNYTWEAIYHTGLGMRLVGWADNAGKTPYNSPQGNWGGDHGVPASVVTDGKQMYLGWNGSEAGKALVVTDMDGNVKWRHKEGGFGGASNLAVGKGIIYVNSPYGGLLYRLETKKGDYSYWKGKDTAILEIGEGIRGMTYADGLLYICRTNQISVLDAETGEEVKNIDIKESGDIESTIDGQIYFLSSGDKLLRLKADGSTEVVLKNLENASGLAISKGGEFYIGCGEPDNQVQVYSADGKLKRTIGKKGGRPIIGKWEQDGMRYISGMVIDSQGKLWVAEKNKTPKRFSVWNSEDGSFIKEFFGPTAYGATGGAISPQDPMIMVGSGSEWRLNKETGRAVCTGVFHTQSEMGNSRFGVSPDGKEYVATGPWRGGSKPVYIYQRIGEGNYKLRTTLTPVYDDGPMFRGKPKKILGGARVWSDINDDQKEQPNEVHVSKQRLSRWINGWYMPMTQNLTFYGGLYQMSVTGWTKCGAPMYDLAKAKKLPAPEDVKTRGGMGAQHSAGSYDDSLVIYNGHYGKSHSDFVCYDIESGKKKWSYPNNYVGVHGGHRAPSPQVGMINGAYDIVGSGKLPEPIGNFFVIGTDKGTWHILTGEGFYLSKLFEGEALKRQWPNSANPGAILDTVPPGAGAEDFGGSLIMTDDGELHLQAGKTAYINIKVVGLDTVKAIKGGKLKVSQDDIVTANKIRDKLLQQSIGTVYYSLAKKSVEFTNDLNKDFGADKVVNFERTKASSIQAAMAYDDNNLYLGWKVKDSTPWVNGASDSAQMYAMGDTVDFQLATDLNADPKRTEAVMGDLRISIGNLKGEPTAVVYRRVAKDKQPKTFYSGVIRDGYTMDSVKVLEDAKITFKVDTRSKDSYVVEAAIPLKSIGLAPEKNLKLQGDIGVTHGDEVGSDTVLRTYWSNQQTGIVADEVFELKMSPNNWGMLTF